MIPIINSIVILIVVVGMGMICVILANKIINLRQDLKRMIILTTEGINRMGTEQRRVANFLNQWIPQAELARPPSQHIHWLVDRSAGPNWYIYECRCGKTEEGQL